MKTTANDFPAFLQGYLTAALWSSTISESYEDSLPALAGQPFDRHFSVDDFDPEALAVLTAHARSFWSRMWHYLDHETGDACHTPEYAGHDFWLTSNGHGAGFWDGDWPTYGDMLTKLSKCYPEINLDLSGDGQRVTID